MVSLLYELRCFDVNLGIRESYSCEIVSKACQINVLLFLKEKRLERKESPLHSVVDLICIDLCVELLVLQLVSDDEMFF